MCDMIVKGLTTVQEAVWTAAGTGYNAVVDSYSCLGRNIENLTNKTLGETAARIVRTMYDALPVTVAALTLPTYVQLSLGAAYFIVHVAYSLVGKEGARPFTDNTYKNTFTGFGTAFLYSAARETVDFASRVKGANLISIAFKIALSSVAYTLFAKFPKPSFAPNGQNGDQPAPVPAPIVPTAGTATGPTPG